MMSALSSATRRMVLAHGGGAPETAMVGVPLLIIALFGWLEVRARKRERTEGGAGDAEDRQRPQA